jgi:hypothetical protein
MKVLAKWLDYSYGRPDQKAVARLGYEGVLRYLCYLPNGKAIDHPQETAAIRGAGLFLALNWEQASQDGAGGAAKGEAHAREAVRLAQETHYTAGCTIPFSTGDTDVQHADYPAYTAYVKAARNVVHGSGYRMGEYGGYWWIKYCFDNGLIDDGWQAYAWSGYYGGFVPTTAELVSIPNFSRKFYLDKRASMFQVQNGIKVLGQDCDLSYRLGRTYFMGQSQPVIDTSGGEDVKFSDNNPFGAAKGTPGETVGGQWFDTWLHAKQANDRITELSGEVAKLHQEHAELKTAIAEIKALLTAPK